MKQVSDLNSIAKFVRCCKDYVQTFHKTLNWKKEDLKNPNRVTHSKTKPGSWEGTRKVGELD